jgi:hypothetical protein
MTTCRVCNETKNESEFPPKTQTCRACCKIQLDRRRGKQDPVRRMLFNLKNRGRGRGIKEVTLWRYEDVRRLYDQVKLPAEVQQGIEQGMQPKFRLVRVDPEQAFLPGNAVVKLFGE